MADLSQIETWVFDLDNTLYPACCNLFAEVDQRMTAFIAKSLALPAHHARFLQKDYYKRYGTTLNGLMQLHKMPPEPFLDYVHDIDLSVIAQDPNLQHQITRLPGKKIIYTNGSRRHAERVAERLGVLHLFDAITDIASNGYAAKPGHEAYQNFVATHALNTRTTIMFDDMPHNLEVPHDLGMVTVLVHSDYIDHPAQRAIKNWKKLPQHIHHQTEDLVAFLKTIKVKDSARSTRQPLPIESQ